MTAKRRKPKISVHVSIACAARTLAMPVREMEVAVATGRIPSVVRDGQWLIPLAALKELEAAAASSTAPANDDRDDGGSSATITRSGPPDGRNDAEDSSAQPGSVPRSTASGNE